VSDEPKRKITFAEQQKHDNDLKVARLQLNIFRQLHAIDTPLADLNADWRALDNDVVDALNELPGGAKLYQHIRNMQEGKTASDKIDEDLLAFGREVFTDQNKFKRYTKTDDQIEKEKQAEEAKSKSADPLPTFEKKAETDDSQYADIYAAIRSYSNTTKGLLEFKEKAARFGDNWRSEIDTILALRETDDAGELIDTFNNLKTYDTAVSLWNEAAGILENPTAPGIAAIQAKIKEYKTYLPMFGASGHELLEKLKELK